jgi:hypothetical protein
MSSSLGQGAQAQEIRREVGQDQLGHGALKAVRPSRHTAASSIQPLAGGP